MSTPEKVQDDLAMDPPSIACSRPSKQIRPSRNAQSSKRKALTELEPSYPRKSARLEQKQRASEYKMSVSPSKKRVAGKAREKAIRGQDRDETKVSVGRVVTRGWSQGKVTTAGSSDKENRALPCDAATTVFGAEGTEMTLPVLQRIEALVPPHLGSPPKRKDPSSRSTSPTKSTSTKTSKTPARLVTRERLALLNPPIKFLTLSDLGKSIPILLKDLWVDHIVSDNEGFIPQALEAKIRPQTLNELIPGIRASCFATDTRYDKNDYERIWLTVMNVVENADEIRHMDYHESHWIAHIVSPMLNLVSKLKRFDKDGMRIRALDIQTVDIDPPALHSYSSNAQFKDLDKRIDCALGLHLSQEERFNLTRGLYKMEAVSDSINQTSSFVNLTPMFLNIKVVRRNSGKDPLIQLAVWISAEFEKRRIENYSLDMPVLAIAIQEDKWRLYMVYAHENVVDKKGYRLRFVGPKSLGNTSSLQDCFQLLDGLCRCTDWGVGKYQSWIKKEVLDKYRPANG